MAIGQSEEENGLVPNACIPSPTAAGEGAGGEGEGGRAEHNGNLQRASAEAFSDQRGLGGGRAILRLPGG